MAKDKDKKKKESKQSAVKTFAVNKSLKCILTQEELLAAGNNLAIACESKVRLDEEKKSVMAGFTARLKEKEAQVGTLQNVVQNKFEFRQVPCEEKHDYAKGFVTTIRKDTGEVVEEREMTTEERQGKMFDDADANGGENKDEPNFD